VFGRSLRFYLRSFSLVSCGRNSKYPDAVGFGIQRKKSAVVYGIPPPLRVVRMRITLAGATKYPDAVGFGIQRKKSAVVYGIPPPLRVVRMRITLAGAILKFHSFAEAVKLRIAALCEKGTVMV